MTSLADAVARCREQTHFLAALRDAYAAVDALVARRGWVCRACGECCDFVRSGHRLYVSAGELALLAQAPPPQAVAPGQCPYQVNGGCTARDRRALGCRVFFCDPASRDECRQLYETYHGRIRRLHDACGPSYAYMELTAALTELFPAAP